MSTVRASLFTRTKTPAAVPVKKGSAAAKKAAAAAAPLRKQSFLEALDFSQARSRSDALLLQDARAMKKGDKMTPEQYAALRRKIGGTAKDYWKSYIQAEGKYVEKGYVATDSAVSLPPGFGLLVATLFGLLAVVGVVVSRAA